MIALCVHWGGRPFNPDVVRRVVQSLESGAGPLGKAHSIGLGMFAATLAPAECIHTPHGELLLFHGFIQNRKELRTRLERSPGSDAALYAAAWTTWGDAADTRVIGEYVSIVVDSARPQVRLARAAIQAPPLHCYRDQDLLVVASVSRAVFATGAARAEIDEQKIADSLYLNYAEGERDWFKGLTRLAVGTCAYDTRDGSVAKRYYDLAAAVPVRLSSDEDYVEAASELLSQGTRAALEGRSQPAIALSGGLDSQAVAVHALSELPEGTSLIALTGVPERGWDGRVAPGALGDERGQVAALAAMYPALHTENVDAAGRSFDYRLREVFLWAGGPPRNAMNLHWLHALHARARTAGCDVLLTGSLGNFSFSFDGCGAMARLFTRGRWWQLAREIVAMQNGLPFARNLLSKAILPNLPEHLVALLRRLRQTQLFNESLPAWCPLRPEYARQMRVVARGESNANMSSTLAWRQSALNGAAGEAGELTQAMEIIHGVPMRDPTAYRPLVEFCLGIPDDQFVHRGVKRRLAKRILRGRVPDQTIDERRVGIQCADWHVRLERQREELEAELEQLGGDPAMAKRFDLSRLQAALADWPEQTPDGAQQQVLQLALPRALATARFIRNIEQTNA